uniref:Uncharacterized protein n=1 Tax=Fagus sylvatica TaxID=28930 RepID=A0A2N9ID47_FAGSY
MSEGRSHIEPRLGCSPAKAISGDFRGWLAFYGDRVDFPRIYVDLFLEEARLSAAADARYEVALEDPPISSSF